MQPSGPDATPPSRSLFPEHAGAVPASGHAGFHPPLARAAPSPPSGRKGYAGTGRLGFQMRLERIVWMFQGLVLLIFFLGAFLVSLLPDPMQTIGWFIIVLLAAIVSAVGFLLVRRGGNDSGGRYIWSTTT